MSSDFLNIDVVKLPHSLYGEVPTFLAEHHSGNAVFTVYGRMKAARIAMTTSCMAVLLNDFSSPMHIELVGAKATEPWDICLYYFFLHAQSAARRAREFLSDRLLSQNPSVEISAIFCLMYEDALNIVGRGSAVAQAILHLCRRIGIDLLLSAAERGNATVPSPDLNHVAKIITDCIKITPRNASVSFDLAEFSAVALAYIGTSCAVSDVLEPMRKIQHVPGNDLLALVRPDRTGLF